MAAILDFPDAITCPLCRIGTLEIVTDGYVEDVYHPGYHVAERPLPTRRRYVPFGACNSCEFCIEINLSFATANNCAAPRS